MWRVAVKPAWLATILIAGTVNECGHDTTQPGIVAFSGDSTLVCADDWVANQACNYVIPTDETVCDWGRLAVTADRRAISIRGFDVHKGLPLAR